MHYQHPESLSADERRWRDYLIGRLNKMEALHMSTNATLTDLDNSLGDVETAVNALPTLITTQKNDLVTLFKDLEAKFASYGVTPNFSTEVTRAKAIVANLNTIAETLSANTTEVTNEDTSVDAPKRPERVRQASYRLRLARSVTSRSIAAMRQTHRRTPHRFPSPSPLFSHQHLHQPHRLQLRRTQPTPLLQAIRHLPARQPSKHLLRRRRANELPAPDSTFDFVRGLTG
jgi:hypothetical protein